MGLRKNKTKIKQKHCPPKNSKCLSSILQNVHMTAAVQYVYGSSNYHYRGGHATNYNNVWLPVAAQTKRAKFTL
jgi:hypothetical protein